MFFPEFSNKVTWAVVIAGIGLTSSPFLQSILNEILKREYNIKILGDFDYLVGVVLIILGLTHNILLQREKTKIEINGKFDIESEERASKRSHDVELFKRITEGFEEYFITEYISSLNDDHSYLSSEKNRLRNFIYYSNETEYDFINSKVNDSLSEFGSSLSQVMNWCALNFFHYPENIVMEDQRYCLHPELNPERGNESGRLDEYNEYARELVILTDELLAKYKAFRIAVKSELFI